MNGTAPGSKPVVGTPFEIDVVETPSEFIASIPDNWNPVLISLNISTPAVDIISSETDLSSVLLILDKYYGLQVLRYDSTLLQLLTNMDFHANTLTGLAMYIPSDISGCSAGVIAGLSQDTRLCRAGPNLWTFNDGTSIQVPGFLRGSTYGCVGCSAAPAQTTSLDRDWETARNIRWNIHC